MAAPADKELARTLVKTGVLTPEQLGNCEAAAGDSPGDVTVIEVALRRGYLDRTQVDLAQTQVESEKTRSAALRRDSAVATFALRQKFVTREQIEACRTAQLEQQKAGADVTLLQTLVEANCISEEQRQVIASAVGETGYRRLGDFEITRRLGEGGMGAVYKARQVSMDRPVALKILPSRLASDETYVKRFYREARVSARLNHPNTVRGLAVGEADGHHYFAMEFVDGPSLRQILDRSGTLPLWRAVPMFIELAKGLAHAHAQGLVHRDIKPDNIMLTRDGVPKLADLGLAKETGGTRSAITESGTAMGTAYYMAPEQARDAKRVDARSDIYSLGATLYHVLTGRVPYEGETFVEVARKHREDPLVSPRKVNPEIPDRLALIVEQMMNKNPDHRFKSAEEVVQALEQIHVARPRPKAGPVGERPRVEMVRAASERAAPARDLWYVRLPGPGGKPEQRTFDLPMLQRYIERGRIPLDAPVRKGTTAAFGRMDRHPQLARSLRLRRARDEDHVNRGQPYREIYQAHDRRLARRVLIRRIRVLVRWVIGLGLLGVAAWAFVTYVLPLIKR